MTLFFIVFVEDFFIKHTYLTETEEELRNILMNCEVAVASLTYHEDRFLLAFCVMRVIPASWDDSLCL